MCWSGDFPLPLIGHLERYVFGGAETIRRLRAGSRGGKNSFSYFFECGTRHVHVTLPIQRKFLLQHMIDVARLAP